MIARTVLKHGWFYHYRINKSNLEKLSIEALSPIKKYLQEVFDDCPNQLFESNLRGSKLKFNIKSDIFKINNHEISNWTKFALENYSSYKTSHSKVELCLLERDGLTVATEVPLWLNREECDSLKHIFESEEPLTGHIDILRIEDGLVWIWDYKPNAIKEKYASTQVFFYAYMLSKRTGVPLEKFRCGYFDENISFVFKPELGALT